MAEEGCVGNHSGKVLAEVSKDRHACYGVRREIQKAEPVRVHDVDEEIGERRTEPAVKLSNEERVSIRVAPGGSRKRAGSKMAIRLLPPHAPVLSDQGVLVER